MMMKRWADGIGDYLIKQGAEEEDNRELLCYGIFQILSNVQQVFILLVLSLLLGCLPQVGVFSLCYAMLRRYIGGAHAGRHWLCLLTFTATALLIPAAFALCPAGLIRPLSAALALVMVVLVFWRAPVIHPNSPKSRKSVMRFRRLGRVTALLECFMALMGGLLLPQEGLTLLLCSAAGGFTAALTLLPPPPKPEGGETA